MALGEDDRRRIVDRLGREPTRTETALFENLWSEHCAYRTSGPLLTAFDSQGDDVVVGPGDDAAVVALDDEWYLTVGVESHNHPSYVDPHDGAATGVGGIVRDTLSMGAYPIALADCLYFGAFDREESQYLLEGVVDGISEYANAIGVPTVTGSLSFHPGYTGNPLVNVACVGLLPADRLVTAAADRPGDKLVLVGNATGRDGIGGASFASEDLSEDAETEDRPAVQVGDPYVEKLLIEANEKLLDRGLVTAARDLGAAGLGGATAEMVAKGGCGCTVELGAVHQRESDMNGTELLLAESQERMCYAVAPEDLSAVRSVAERYELGCSVVGTVSEQPDYVCRFDGQTIVDAPAEFVVDGATTYDRHGTPADGPDERSLPSVSATTAFEAVVADPSVASRQWVYRQYDHEVGLRTTVGPGADAATLGLREPEPETEPETTVALTAGAVPGWTQAAPYDGTRNVVVAAATALATVGASPLAVVNCLNGGNPETAAVFDGFEAAVNGLADACRSLDVPVVGGNVSLYNDSAAGPIPPTPTVVMLGRGSGRHTALPPIEGDGSLLLIGGHTDALGGSTCLSQFGGTDAVPTPPPALTERLTTLAAVTQRPSTQTVASVADGGLAATLARLVAGENERLAGASAGSSRAASARVSAPGLPSLFSEAVGRAVIETTDPDGVQAAFGGHTQVTELGKTAAAHDDNDADGTGSKAELAVTVGDQLLRYDAGELRRLRATLERELD